MSNLASRSSGEPSAIPEEREELREAAMRGRIAEIRARLAAVTPGEWRHATKAVPHGFVANCGQDQRDANHYVVPASPRGYWKPNGADADAEFIANAKADLAALCDFAESRLSGGIPRSLSEEPNTRTALSEEERSVVTSFRGILDCDDPIAEVSRANLRMLVATIDRVSVAPLPSSERPDEGVVRCAKCARWHAGVNTADVKTNLCEDCASARSRR